MVPNRVSSRNSKTVSKGSWSHRQASASSDGEYSLGSIIPTVSMLDGPQALAMGLVNTVVPLARLEEETLVWCREMLRNSPTALRVLKSALNAAEDGQAGLQACRTMFIFAFFLKRQPHWCSKPSLKLGLQVQVLVGQSDGKPV